MRPQVLTVWEILLYMLYYGVQFLLLQIFVITNVVSQWASLIQ